VVNAKADVEALAAQLRAATGTGWNGAGASEYD